MPSGHMGAWRLLMLALLLMTSGCARRITLQLEAGPCLNPPGRYCTPDGSNSLVLEARVYQLKGYVDPATLSWEDLLTDGKDLAILQPYLSDASKTTVVRQALYVERNTRQRPRIQRLKGTRYLLVVTAGRHASPGSVLLLPLKRGQREVRLAFDRFDVRLLEGASAEPIP